MTPLVSSILIFVMYTRSMENQFLVEIPKLYPTTISTGKITITALENNKWLLLSKMVI